MSLVTIERSSSSDNLSQISGELLDSEEDQIDGECSDDIFARSRTTSSVEGFFASKGAAIAIPDGDFARKVSLKGGEIQSHLQGMVNVIRDEDTMRLVVKVESEAKYIRYLCIVTTYGLSDEEESVVLGFDWIEDEVTLGLVIPLWSNVSTKLDGDGGFEIKTEHRNYIFKPVSVQTLWTALLWIHKCLNTAHKAKHFNGGLSHAWLDHYQNRISSPRECINFWESMDEVENKRDISYSYFDKVKTDEELLKGSIRNKLKEILTRFDLEEVTCRQVRLVLEEEMKMSLQHLKGYVDEQLFVILGQMESATKITDHLYLGSEWNACNLQELKDHGVGYILNITKEVDNFFPGTFEYMNIRLYDVKEADLMCHWGKTYRFIHKAKEHNVAVLVHCRRGISRSASTVIAYLMKENKMCLSDAMKFVKSKRSIVQPNSGFWKQLIIYEGILKSSRNRHNSLFRRRSNSDSINTRRTHKKGRHDSNTDHVDSNLGNAHTLPKMTNDVLVENEAPSRNQPSDEEDLDSVSSEDQSSNSDEDPGNNRLKIRRTVSEPAMMTTNDVMMMATTSGKPRSRTFIDRQPNGASRSTTIISEEDDGAVWMDMMKDSREKTGKRSEISNQEAVVSSTDECLKSEVSSEVKASVAEGNVENVISENVEVREAMQTCADDNTIDSELLTNTSDLNSTEQCCDVAQPSGVEDSPCVDVNVQERPREESPHEDATPLLTPRQRSRSIGEKLVDKQKQGKCEDNLKKVHLRGRVRRRERKAKSDLQLSSSGFVKRHTQIIEEQMLYSLLMNSDETLATLACDFWKNNEQQREKKSNNLDNAGTDLVNKADLAQGNVVTDSEEISLPENVFEKSSKSSAKVSECVQSVDKESEETNDLLEQCRDNFVQNSCDKSPKDFDNCSEEKQTLPSALQELNTIVQEVNAEARRDIRTGSDCAKPCVVAQSKLSDSNESELRHRSMNDDVCIDEMTWIGLSQHQGDVVERRSAAFEKTECCLCETKASLPPDEHAQEENTKCSSMMEIPKPDLDDSKDMSSNSIIVEDYNSWESSSVRDRTAILENIIARTGGSFPSPRSRRPELDPRLEQGVHDLDISSKEDRATTTSFLETPSEEPGEGVFGDAPVKNLVDKFEGKNGDSE